MMIVDKTDMNACADKKLNLDFSQKIRLFLLFLLLGAEVLLVAYIYEPVRSDFISLHRLNIDLFFRQMVSFTLILFSFFFIFVLAQHQKIFEDWSEASQNHQWPFYLVTNVVLFAGQLALTILFNQHSADINVVSQSLNILWHIGLLLLCSSLALTIAPLKFWVGFLKSFYLAILLAVLGAFTIIYLAAISQDSWHVLAEPTFRLSHWLLSFMGSDIYVDAPAKKLGLNNFIVEIDPYCSGYEGIGLVVAFLTLYIIAFRKALKFPNIFVLYLIGVPLIWFLNGVRIASLISIGAYISPEIAVDGFHSRAGWIMFLVVTISMMLVSSRISFFTKNISKGESRRENPAQRLAMALLMPFIALMGASLIASAFSTEGGSQGLYVLKVIAVLIPLWIYRNVYIEFIEKVSLLSVIVGILIGVIWIVTDTKRSEISGLEIWLNTLPMWAFTGWLILRVIGTTILIPIAEELAFRNYLYRAFAARRFETIQLNQFSWLALIGSSILFGALHSGRFVEATIAGAIYALLMIRTNRMSDPIAAHMASNIVIAFWAIIMGQWSLL